MWTGPAPMRPYNKLVHPRSWRAFMEYGNGIVGDMCVHMLDMVRWMMDLGMPTRIDSSGGILVDKASKANITDSQIATFDFPNLQVVWTHRSYGDAPDPKYPWAATFYGDKGTLKAGVMGYDFVPSGKGQAPMHEDVTYELDQFPEDRTEKDLETARRAGDPRAHEELPGVRRRTAATRSSDIEQGYMSTTACILANLSMKLGRSLEWDHANGVVVERCRSQQAAAPALSRTVGAPRSEDGLSTFNVQRATCDVRRATCDVLRATCDVRQSRFSAHLKPRVSRSWNTGSFHVASPCPIVVPNTRVEPLY